MAADEKPAKPGKPVSEKPIRPGDACPERPVRPGGAAAPVRPARPDDAPPAPPSAASRGAAEVQSPLDALQSVAFADGDVAVEAVGEVAPGPHRSSPLGIAVALAKTLLVLAVVAVSLLASLALEGAGAVSEADAVALVATFACLGVFLVAMVVATVVSWRVNTWELADDGLVLRSGVFVRKQRRIPYQRVHSVDLSASVVERILGLVSLKVDTGAGETGEGNAVRALRRTEAEALKRALFARRVLVEKGTAAADVDGAAASADPAADPVLDPAADVVFEMRLSNRAYVRAALTELNLGAAFASVLVAFASALQFAGDVLGGVLLTQVESMLDQAVAGAVDAAPRLDALALLPVVVAWVVALVLAVLVVTWVISSVMALVRWGGFVARRRGDRLEVTAGLLSRSTRAVELGRVQAVVVNQTPIRRALGYVQIAVRTVGSASSGGSSDAAKREYVVIHPCVRRDEAAAFLAQALPEFADIASVPVADLGLHRLPAAALRRTLLHGLYWTLALALLAAGATYGLRLLQADPLLAPLAVVACEFMWAALVLGCAAMFVVRVLAWRLRRIGTAGPVLVTVDGGVYRRVGYLARAKVQSLTRRATPFQAHAGVATVSARTACVSAEPDPRMRDVAAADAAELMAWARPHYDNAAQAQKALREAGVL